MGDPVPGPPMRAVDLEAEQVGLGGSVPPEDNAPPGPHPGEAGELHRGRRLVYEPDLVRAGSNRDDDRPGGEIDAFRRRWSKDNDPCHRDPSRDRLLYGHVGADLVDAVENAEASLFTGPCRNGGGDRLAAAGDDEREVRSDRDSRARDLAELQLSGVLCSRALCRGGCEEQARDNEKAGDRRSGRDGHRAPPSLSRRTARGGLYTAGARSSDAPNHAMPAPA